MGRRLERVLELTPTPPANRVLTADDIEREWPVYPLELYFCHSCFHVQLGHVVDPAILFRSNYSYVSGTSLVFVEHLRSYAEHARYAREGGQFVLPLPEPRVVPNEGALASAHAAP